MGSYNFRPLLSWHPRRLDAIAVYLYMGTSIRQKKTKKSMILSRVHVLLFMFPLFLDSIHRIKYGGTRTRSYPNVGNAFMTFTQAKINLFRFFVCVNDIKTSLLYVEHNTLYRHPRWLFLARLVTALNFWVRPHCSSTWVVLHTNQIDIVRYSCEKQR